MHRFLLVLFALVLLAAQPAPGMAAAQSYSAGRVDVAVDGTWVGLARSMSGGDPRGTVTIQKPNGAAQKKSLSGVAYAPIVLEMDLPLSPVLLNWMIDFCANKYTRKTLLLTTSGTTASNATTLQAMNTQLIEVRFPAVDAASKDPWRITLVFSPETTNSGGTPPPSSTVATKQTTSSSYRFTLAGLTTTSVSKIAAFAIKRADVASATGELRDYTSAPAAVDFPNLVVTVSGAATDWTAWRQDFIINGNSSDAAEKNGLIELLSSDLKTTLFSLQLSHVGLVRVTPSAVESNSEKIASVEAELYVEGMTTAAPASTPFKTAIPKKGHAVGEKGATSEKTDPTKTATDPTKPAESSRSDDPTKPVSDPTLATADEKKAEPTNDNAVKLGESEKTDPTLAGEGKKDDSSSAGAGSKKSDQTAGADPTKTTSDPTRVATDEKKGDPTVGTADPSKATERADPTKSTTDPTVASTVPNKTSLAARDIIDFPKPEDAVRRSYNVYRTVNSTQETASYASKSSLPDTVAFYANGLEAAGWSEGNRTENDNAAGEQTQVVMHWTKKLRTASIAVILQKEGGVVINISETTSTK